MDWLGLSLSANRRLRFGTIRVFLLLPVCFFLPASLANAENAVSIGKESELDFSAVMQRVRAASLALQRNEKLIESASANESAVKSQAGASLQLNQSLTGYYVSPFKQQHSLSVGGTLWDFGRQAAQELKAASQRLVAEAQSAEAEEILRVRTARLFAAVCSSEAVLSIAQEQLRNAESKLKTVTAAYQRGERPQSDVIKLKIELGKAQLFVRKSQDESSLLKTQLLLSSDLKPLPAESLASTRLLCLPQRTVAQWKSLLNEFSSDFKDAAVFVRLNAAKISLEAELSALQSDSYPLVNASAGVQASGQLFPLKPDLTAQVNLQYSLPLSSLRDQRRTAVLAKVRENLLNRDEEMKIRAERLQQSKLRADGVLQQKELNKSQIELLLEYQKLVRTRYFAGRASLLELTGTEDELLANRLELTRLELALFVAAIDASEAGGGKNLEKIF
jgi:outer membrane protein TolC